MTGRTHQQPVTAGLAAAGTALAWRIGWLTASRWSIKARLAARMLANLLPAPAADPFIAIAVIILIAVLGTVRIVRRRQRGDMFRLDGPAPQRRAACLVAAERRHWLGHVTARSSS